MTATQEIYCDESGFSGNNLLDSQQPYFTYATVAVSASAASEAVAKTIKDYRIDGDELKGKNLIRHSRGTKAISSLIETFAESAKVSAWHKRYCLASKFFEYIFEPVLAEQNSIFYNAGFHRFISNIMYVFVVAEDRRIGDTLASFQSMIRAKDITELANLFPRTSESTAEGVIEDIEAFVRSHKKRIEEEIESYSNDDPLYSWMLDVSVSALHALLSEWGKGDQRLLVFCDDSKPLRENKEKFDMMIGREDRPTMTMEGVEHSMIFNLAQPIQFVASHDYPGIQIADVFATALATALKNPSDDISKRWFKVLQPSVSPYSVFPDADRVDLNSPSAFVNALILRELVDRSERGANLFAGMPAFIQAARRSHPSFVSHMRQSKLI